MNSLAVARRIGWLLVMSVIVAGFACLIVPECRHLGALQEQRQQLRESNSSTSVKIQELRANSERFRNDPEFVERLARQNGLVKEDEVVFKFKE